MRMKRRTFIAAGSAALGLGMAGCRGGAEPAPESQDTTADTGALAFTSPLLIPPELTGTLEGGRRVYNLSMQKGQTEFFAGQPTETWGYNGALLGPTLRARRGEQLSIIVENQLDETATTHWHGAHLPAAADGGPHQVIEPGESWTSQWTVNQKGCTNWYHPHTMDETARQVYMGLAGLFIIEDEERDGLDLPSTYGVDDIPIILQERSFDGDGQLVYSLSNMDIMEGFRGDTYIVNGVFEPFVEVPAKQVRLRILNGSNAGFYELELSDGGTFQLIGVDNSLLPSPVSLTQLKMGPGERAEIVLDLSGREGESLRLVQAEGGVELLELVVVESTLSPTTLPAELTTLEQLAPESAVTTRTFAMAMLMGGCGGGPSFTINNASMDLQVINETVPLGDVEIWEISNVAMMRDITHNFHMHGTHFQVLSRNGEPVGPEEGGYKDTVVVPSGETVRVILRHTDYSDESVPYMYHCHVLEHEDRGMMGQFVVV